jgi:hypothetical protein
VTEPADDLRRDDGRQGDHAGTDGLKIDRLRVQIAPRIEEDLGFPTSARQFARVVVRSRVLHIDVLRLRSSWPDRIAGGAADQA